MSLSTRRPLVYLITKGEATADNFDTASRQIIDIVTLAVSLKVNLIQVREKHLSARALFELTQTVVDLAKGSAIKVLVNDRADIALAAGADGVHLAANSISAKVIRDNFPKDFLIGVSTHNIEEVKRAASDGADFAVFGPVFETPGKDSVVGVEKLKEVCDAVSAFPILALGGVDETNFNSVLQSGASGFAAIRVLNNSQSLDSVMKHLRNK